MNIVFIVHYFPPVNSAGAKRVEAISKYLAAAGHTVTVITTKKTSADGDFSEPLPEKVKVLELDKMGRISTSEKVDASFEPMYVGNPSWRRKLKNYIQNILGQVPDPRLPFAFSFLSPWLDPRAKVALAAADIVVGSSPPWPMLLAALFCKKRFNVPCVLDYRDQFSECHGMPGGSFAKWLELRIDRWLARSADHVVTISEPMASYYKAMTTNVSVIMNGYDHLVLNQARSAPIVRSADKVTIRYMGIVSPERVPHNFMKALVQLKKDIPENFEKFNVEYYGRAELVKQAIENQYPSIASAFSFSPAVAYTRSLELIIHSDYLLFAETSVRNSLSAQGILTTKLFEYIGSGRPVLADISADTLAGSILKKAHTSSLVDNSQDSFLAGFRHPDFYPRQEDSLSEFSQGFSRQSQALQYADLLTSVINKK
ncbi:glycosyltransferase [Pseudomonas protegens]|uniref:glycosyltransferase n=1 Tax=Pseudomonas protegens TaxID=380021 RepID=UPI001B308C98|nr:glycosyltransferase [Pseudomonas protegens]MBP5100090.1 glycosyltransferase [Pseudomonas protegens]MBP5116468.1 glycosyltransferase [Pseudomonas protegens]QTU08837.1 glycosyltransferase [Pseudomonas protegens]QTU15146.1 glycosyltransferase [Pseudomonas protegens]QTU17832.1 glycosyltransferase [Pseudomonas protegens]